MKATLPQQIKLDEREHVEKPLLDQLPGLGWDWDVIDLTDKKQAHRIPIGRASLTS